MNASSPGTIPAMPINDLDSLWFQVSGTLCNLTCRHCFISCSPHNRSVPMLDLAVVESYLKQAEKLGVKEYYFTGGEPFLNRQMVDILLRTLDFGPATILTNATVLREEWLERLSAKVDRVPYGLEFRVSLDGYDPSTNDPIRGEGVFDRTIQGVGKLLAHGFLPILTVTRSWPENDDGTAMQRFAEAMASVGCQQPRIKILPTLKLGAEAENHGGYEPAERVEAWMLDEVGHQHFVCGHSRLVSARGVHVCPILLEEPEGLLGGPDDELATALVPFPMKQGACYTCYQYGAICSNTSSESRSG